MRGVFSVDVALAEQHIGGGHTQDASFYTLGSLYNRAERTARGLGARESVAVASVVKDDEGIGVALTRGIDGMQVFELAAKVRPCHAISSGRGRSRRRRRAGDGGRHVARG